MGRDLTSSYTMQLTYPLYHVYSKLITIIPPHGKRLKVTKEACAMMKGEAIVRINPQSLMEITHFFLFFNT